MARKRYDRLVDLGNGQSARFGFARSQLPVLDYALSFEIHNEHFIYGQKALRRFHAELGKLLAVHEEMKAAEAAKQGEE